MAPVAAVPMAVPLSWNVTVNPCPGLGDTVAVRVTGWPATAGFGDTASDSDAGLKTVSVTIDEALEV